MFALSTAITRLVPDLMLGARVELVEVGQATAAPAPSAVCRFGRHEFYSMSPRAMDPDVCPEHRAVQAWEKARAEQRELFEAITDLSGLVPELRYGGGGVIVFDIALDASGEREYPHYRGMLESRESSGGLNGGIEYFATEEQEGEGTLIISSWGEDALPASVWATRLAEHHNTLTT